LKIITLQKTLRDVDLILRHSKPSVGGKYRDFVSPSHVGEDHPARLDTGISGMMDLVFQLATGRLRGGFKHVAFDVVLPAMIDAPQTGLFVATVKQRSPSMATVLVQQADSPLSVTKSDEVLAEKSNSYGRTIGIGNFLRQQSWDPISPEQTTHRGAGMH
jgi:hypothetical protein